MDNRVDFFIDKTAETYAEVVREKLVVDAVPIKKAMPSINRKDHNYITITRDEMRAYGNSLKLETTLGFFDEERFVKRLRFFDGRRTLPEELRAIVEKYNLLCVGVLEKQYANTRLALNIYFGDTATIDLTNLGQADLGINILVELDLNVEPGIR